MSSRVFLSNQVGRVKATEPDNLWTPDPLDGDKYPVILVHGAGATALNAFTRAASFAESYLGPMVGYSGRKAVAGWFGSSLTTDPFANSTHMDCIEDAITLTGAAKAHIWGASMGGGAAVRFASLNPTLVASIMCVIPMSDMQAMYAANRGGLRANMGTAWGVTYPTPLPTPDTDLIGTHAPAVAAAGIPRRLQYSTADVLVLPAEATALAAGLGITGEVIDTTSGHTETTIEKAMNLDLSYPWADYIDWIDGLDS